MQPNSTCENGDQYRMLTCRLKSRERKWRRCGIQRRFHLCAPFLTVALLVIMSLPQSAAIFGQAEEGRNDHYSPPSIV